ncbi:MAG: sigma-70 family RNA polymerase sigma factor [Planctomycetes bacterium]|nr:sigma-70 family RNA polymerase sigma factor [Planctomycetota bacterium]
MTTGPSALQRDEMFMLHQGLVRAIAWKTHQRLPRSVELDDLVAYGQIGLLESIAAFDATRGRKFTTYAWHRIRGAMLDGLSKMAWFDRAAFEGRQYERKPTDTAATADSPAAQEGTAERPPARRPTRNDLENVALMSREADAGAASLHLELVMFLGDLLSGLPEKEAALVRGTFFEGRTLTEAARRVGISTAWASRLQTRTLADLRIALERGGFG